MERGARVASQAFDSNRPRTGGDDASAKIIGPVH
jgi:hypothetical protein